MIGCLLIITGLSTYQPAGMACIAVVLVLFVTDVRIGAVDFPRGATEATVTVSRSFYRTNELQERTETLLQNWQLRGGRWLILAEPPTPTK